MQITNHLKKAAVKKLDDKDNPGGLFIPAGIMTGMGFGFYVGTFQQDYSLAISMWLWAKKR